MGSRLYVGNLSFDCTETELREFFEEQGRPVREVHVVMDRETGRSRGFAFVEMETPADARATIEEVDGRELMGRPLRVNVARERGRRPDRPRRPPRD
jgi:RNA recognition motif-containing protein